MRVLVIGAGMYVTGRHGAGVGTILASLAQASKELPLTEVVVAARNPENAAIVAEATARINAAVGASLVVRYQSLEDGKGLADQLRLADFACAIVAVPDHLHFVIAAELLRNGVMALVVKPLVPTVAEARQLIAIQNETGTYAAVEFHKRWDESNLFAKRCIAEGRIGKPVYGLVEYSQRIAIPAEVFRGWADKTNIFQYLGVHYVDLIYFLTNLRPLKAMAIGTRGVLTGLGIDTYDSILAHIVWGTDEDDPRQFVSHLSIGWIDPNRTSALSDQRIKIIGEDGRIECDQKDRGIQLVTEDAGVQHANPYFADFLPDMSGGLEFQGYGYRSIETFLQDVKAIGAGKRTFADFEAIRPTLRSSLVSTAVLEAINQSLRQGSAWTPIQLWED